MSGAAQAQEIEPPQSCPARCFNSRGELMLSPAAARACLADEKRAAALPAALQAQAKAQAQAQAQAGALSESRLILARVEKTSAACIGALALERQRADEYKKQRWYFGAAGAAGASIIFVVIALIAR